MRILILEPDIFSTEVTGVGQTSLNLCKAWLDEGNEVTIVMPENLRDYDLLQESLKKAKILPLRKTPNKKSAVKILSAFTIRLLQSIKHVNKLTAEEKIDIIFTSGILGLLVSIFGSAVQSLKYKRKPIIIVGFYTSFYWNTKIIASISV